MSSRPFARGLGRGYLGALYTVCGRGRDRTGLWRLFDDLGLLALPLPGIMLPSTMKATMMYMGHSQYAPIVTHATNIHFVGDILHYSTEQGSVDLGIGTFYRVVHFFYTPGILSLPYQFYHHACCFISRPA